MSKRFRLKLDMGPGIDDCEVGWMEVTPSGMILEAYFFDPVGKLTAGEQPHNDTRCTWCALDQCVKDLVTPGADTCLCCKSNHGQVDPNTIQPVKSDGDIPTDA